jgi:hypothetical protein
VAVAKHRHEPDDGAATEHHPLDAARQACSGCQPGFGALSRVAERVCVQSPHHSSPSFPIFIAEHVSRPVAPPLYLLPRLAQHTHPPTHPPAHPPPTIFATHRTSSAHLLPPPTRTARRRHNSYAHRHRRARAHEGHPRAVFFLRILRMLLRVLVEAFAPWFVVSCLISGWIESSARCPSKLSVNRTNRPASQRR